MIGKRKVSYGCGHTMLYDSHVPSAGDTITCVRCNEATEVVAVDNRILGVKCDSCGRVVTRLEYGRFIGAETLAAKHNIANAGHKAYVVTLGEIEEPPCLLDLFPAQQDEPSH